MTLGQKIRETRQGKGITLRRLAKEIGVSPSFISQVEQSKAKPSVQSLQSIAKVLDVNCSFLIGEGPTTGEAFITESAVRTKNTFNPGNFKKVSIKNLVPGNVDSIMTPSLLTVEPGATTTGDISAPYGEEFLLVLSGSLTITLNGSDYKLKEGDNIYFNASVPHRIENPTNQIAKVLWIKAA
jgi:quercetin dioxygenase-like cupin family protein